MTKRESITAETLNARYARHNCHVHNINSVLASVENTKLAGQFDATIDRTQQNEARCARQPIQCSLRSLTVNCVPKLPALAKLLDASFGRKHEARCARGTTKNQIDRIVILNSQLTLHSHFNFCTKRYM